MPWPAGPRLPNGVRATGAGSPALAVTVSPARDAVDAGRGVREWADPARWALPPQAGKNAAAAMAPSAATTARDRVPPPGPENVIPSLYVRACAGSAHVSGRRAGKAHVRLCVMTDCIFCRIVAGQAPAYVVAADDLSLAFLDRGQATAGHTLVVPRRHAADLWEVSEPDLIAVMLMAKQVAHLLDERLAPDGLNLTQSNRAAGWQDVFHFHVHVIPRWSDDGLTPPWKSSRPSEAELAATLARLR